MGTAIKIKMGERLVILGAGIGGCFTAATCAPYFKETLMIDRDAIPDSPVERPGVPQSPHIHGLLRAPLDIANEVFPGFEEELISDGALSLKAGMRARYNEGGTWQPKRDLGLNVAAQSRVFVEHALRRKALKVPGVSMRDQMELVDYVIINGVVTGVLLRSSDGRNEIINADLVVDSTGRSSSIVNLLEQHGYTGLEKTELGVDISYTSAYFTRQESDDEAVGSLLRSEAPDVRSGVQWPIENGRWVISMSGRFGDFPPADDEGFAEYAKSLKDPLLYETIQKQERVSEFNRFMIPRIYWRHYEKMETFPERLIPIGDTVQAFNPVYGQGMAVAAIHAREVSETLKEQSESEGSLDAISANARQRVASMTEWAWNLTEPVDLIFEKTEGARPEGFEARIAFSDLMRKALVDSPEIHETFACVTNMVKSPDELFALAANLGLLEELWDGDDA